MLAATELHIKGRHQDLVPATSLQAPPGSLLLVQADGAETRTALALTLTGRMKPTSGAVRWGHDPGIAHLRRHTALLDAPGVNEPERHLSVNDLVAEDLALVPRKFRDRTRPTAWLVKHGYSALVGQWVEQLPPAQRLALLADLALADADVDVLVVDSPDRHGDDPQAWLPLLQRLARAADDGGRQLTVIATVGSVPGGWDGAVACVGDRPPENLAHPVEPHTAHTAVEPGAAVTAVETLTRTEESQETR